MSGLMVAALVFGLLCILLGLFDRLRSIPPAHPCGALFWVLLGMLIIEVCRIWGAASMSPLMVAALVFGLLCILLGLFDRLRAIPPDQPCGPLFWPLLGMLIIEVCRVWGGGGAVAGRG